MSFIPQLYYFRWNKNEIRLQRFINEYTLYQKWHLWNHRSVSIALWWNKRRSRRCSIKLQHLSHSMTLAVEFHNDFVQFPKQNHRVRYCSFIPEYWFLAIVFHICSKCGERAQRNNYTNESDIQPTSSNEKGVDDPKCPSRIFVDHMIRHCCICHLPAKGAIL